MNNLYITYEISRLYEISAWISPFHTFFEAGNFIFSRNNQRGSRGANNSQDRVARILLNSGSQFSFNMTMDFYYPSSFSIDYFRLFLLHKCVDILLTHYSLRNHGNLPNGNPVLYFNCEKTLVLIPSLSSCLFLSIIIRNKIALHFI